MSPIDATLTLEQGDNLRADEFQRRYRAQPDLKKAELIDGEVYLPSPLSQLEQGDFLTADEFDRRQRAMGPGVPAELIDGYVHLKSSSVSHAGHGAPNFSLIFWLGTYKVATPGTDGGANSTVMLDDRNVPQPDALMRILAECGGQSRVKDRNLEGPPELTGEVASSSISYDRHRKKEMYRNCVILEYIVWRVSDAQVDWFVCRGDAFEPLAADSSGILKSEVFPGLWLDPKALAEGDDVRVAAVLQEGLRSAEHARFVGDLAERRHK